jgi:predicted metal-dependent peptidase
MENKDGPSDLPEWKPPVISENDKRKMLSNATYHLSEQEKFYGGLMQELMVKYDSTIPTLCLKFNPKNSEFEVLINPNFFSILSPKERVALLQHEILHFTNKHVFRFPFLKNKTIEMDRFVNNVSADIAINQYIPNLPNGCPLCRDVKIDSPEQFDLVHSTPEDRYKCPSKGLDVKEFLKDDGTPFPTLRSTEEYDSLIKEEKKKQEDKDGNPKPKEGSEEAQAMNGGKGAKPGETTKGTVAKNLKNANTIDEHAWDSLDEETKKKLLEEAKKLIKRTIEKSQHCYGKELDTFKDLLQELEVLSTSLNEKEILKRIIKKTVSCVDRENTWKKPNRRYGIVAPGTKIGQMPLCSFYNDSSGSISIKEQNTYLNIMEKFLKVGSRNCTLAFWHTNLYYKKKYKLGQVIKPEDIENGGTDITCVFQDIKKSNPNLAIILTDGHYDVCDIKVESEVLFIISEDGNKEHPMKHIGKTILLENIK